MHHSRISAALLFDADNRTLLCRMRSDLEADKRSTAAKNLAALLPSERIEPVLRAMQQVRANGEAQVLSMLSSSDDHRICIDPASPGQVLVTLYERPLAQQPVESVESTSQAFITHMGHDIRTPMTSVLTNLELLQLEATTPRQQELVQNALDGAQHQSRLLEDLLQVAQLQNDQLDLVAEVIHVPTLLEELHSMLEYLAQARGLDFELDLSELADEHDWIRAPLVPIQQILHNLINNAISYTKDGSIRIQVRSEEIDTDQVRLICVVADTGPGLSLDDLIVVGQPWQRSDALDQQKPAGFGYGLSIARLLTDRLGGSLHYQPRSGHGSLFTLTLTVPCVDAPDPSSDSYPVSASGMRLLPAQILIAEDDASLLRSTQMLLESLGLRCLLAMDGEQAVQLWQGHRPDLILMDISMPRLDGRMATRAIRRDGEAGAQVPIIAVTALDQSVDQAACREAGINEVIVKPFSRADLVASLHRHLASIQANEEPPDPFSLNFESLTQHPGIDCALLRQTAELVGNGTEGLRSLHALATSLIEESPRILDELQRAISERNAEATVQLTHRLKSRAALLGLKRIRHHAAHMEARSRDTPPPWTDIVSAHEALETDWSNDLEALGDWLHIQIG